MREISTRHLGSLWLSPTPRKWYDIPIEKFLQSTPLPARSSDASAPRYAGVRYTKYGGAPDIFVVLAATFTPMKVDSLTIETAVIKATDDYTSELHMMTASLVQSEAVAMLEQRPILNAGLLRIDKLAIHLVDYSERSWRMTTRVLVGLLSLIGYEQLSDDELVAKVDELAKEIQRPK